MSLPPDLPVDNDPAATRALTLAHARLNVRFPRAEPTRRAARRCLADRDYRYPRRATAQARADLAELEARGV